MNLLQILILSAGLALTILAYHYSYCPSCGCKQVYDGTFSKTLTSGKGVFAQLLANHNFKLMEPEDL